MSEPISTDSLRERLRWRYATKRFDPDRRIDAADWRALEEALVLTPSSYGLQPWKFVVVVDPQVREQLLPHSWNQRQVVDASHFVVFAIKKNVGPREIDLHLDQLSRVRGVPRETLEGFRKGMVADLVNGPRSLVINDWAMRQVYIALGSFMTCCAMLGIDTCPMEGIEPHKFDKLLGLAGEGLATVVACAAGYRHVEDRYATLQKVRFPVEQVIERIEGKPAESP